MKKFFKQLICIIKGHAGFNRNTSYNRMYIREGRKFICKGRLYKCERCGTLQLFKGIAFWEIGDLIQTTLRDLPNNFFMDMLK